jgi:hypothetical protein
MKEDINKLTTDVSKHKSRREAVENEMKIQKEKYVKQIQLLIDKSDNDEKLISKLYEEFEKIRQGYGITNPISGIKEDNNTYFNMQQEVNKLRKELYEKDMYINQLNSNLTDTFDKKNEREQMTSLINRIKILENENKELKANTEDGQLYNSLAKDNAKMRIKILELTEELENPSKLEERLSKIKKK